MTNQEIVVKLNSIAQYNLETVGSAYMTTETLVKKENGGEWIQVEEVAKALGLCIEHGWYGKFQLKG
jgi:hypothetical protein